MDKTEDTILPPHVEETVRAIENLHVEHHEKTTPFERRAAHVTSIIARPVFVGILTVGLAMWIGASLLLPRFAGIGLDKPPFPWLSVTLTVVDLYIVLLILITQKRADTLAARREQLTLQLALMSEQKSAKIIELIEELRRDHPGIENRWDGEAQAMAKPVDQQTVTKALEKAVPEDAATSTKKKDAAESQ
jgi:uncharacterized membrane protein